LNYDFVRIHFAQGNPDRKQRLAPMASDCGKRGLTGVMMRAKAGLGRRLGLETGNPGQSLINKE
jgi:hypothetical protein